LLSFALIGCGGKNSLKKDYGVDAQDAYPAKIQQLFDGKYSASIKAVGMASHPDQEVALQKAGLDADQKIAEQFQMEISALQKKFLEAVNDQKLEEYRNTVENFVNIKIEGVTTAKEMTASGKDGFRAWVMKVVSAEMLKNLIDQRTNALTSFKALQAYKDLEDRVAKEKAETAKTTNQ
jgi:uncharacterized alkaline shock family protein YloU